MAVIVLSSVVGSPGATTSSLLMALQWPRDVLLVDADRVPTQAIESGFLRDRDHASRGLIALAQHRGRATLARALWEQSVPLVEETAPTRRFLSGFSHPGAADLFAPVWDDFGATVAELEAAGVDVIIDAGRVGAGLPTALVRHADSVLVATRTSLRALAALRLSLPMVVEQVGEHAPQAECGLLLIGAGQPYSADEVGEHFGVPILGTLPHDPPAAAHLIDGAPARRRFERSALVRGGIALAQRLAHRVGRRSRVQAVAP
ncbi:hypothetical protein ACSDQ9_14245 [Aestuariimicrobium soli]|uniref:hypothetical protein n=1 Tax=Aestuariimicrobium soli TaxID=2035834 RepID=UPI003EBBC13F